MNASDLSFPVLCTYKDTIFASCSLDTLTITTTAALKGGLFDKLEIIDSLGRIFTVQNVNKIRGIGPFGGFNIFLNRRIKVELFLKDLEKVASLEEVRRKVFRDFGAWHGWKSRGDFDDLKKLVQGASSIAEIISLMGGCK